MPTRQRRAMQLDSMSGSISTSDNLPHLSLNVSSSFGVTPADGPVASMSREMQENLTGLIANEFYSRNAYINKWMDPRRDYNKECGYPETYELDAAKYQAYYERHPIAARVVELMPSECWKETPEVFEDQDPNISTPFEEAFKHLAKVLQNDEQSYFEADEKQSHPLWEICKRADIASRIGQFGLVLIGVDDGLSLNQPIEGWEEEAPANITWNRQGVDSLINNVAENSGLSVEEIGKYVSLNEDGSLTWNLATVVEEDEEEDEEGNKTKKKRLGYLPGMDTDEMDQDAEGVDGTSMPSSAAFGNKNNPQQSDYRDPMDTHGQDDVRSQGTQQPEDDGPKDPNQVDASKFTGESKTPDQPPMELEEAQRPAEPAQQLRNLTFLRVFPENLVQIIQYEQNMASKRFGKPVTYRITLIDPMQQQTGVGLPLSTVEVHYSRVVHLNDVGDNFSSSEIFSPPAMRPVLNNLVNMEKTYGSAGEGFWKNAFATLVAETHPQLGGDVTMDKTAMRGQMKSWRDSLDRILAATGVTFKTLAPQVNDPTPFINNDLQAVCIKLSCPLRVFMGSEQGVLAANEDSRNWYGRVKGRCNNYLIPRLIVRLIDRLIRVRVLPPPQKSYGVTWDAEHSLSPQEQAQVASALTQAMAAYISGQVDQFMEPVTYLVEVWGWDTERAQSAIDATMEHIQRQQQAQAQQGQQMIDPSTGQPLEQDEMGQFLDPNTGQPLQTDEMGQPVMQDPETGEPVPVQSQSPQEQQGPLGAEAAMGDLSQADAQQAGMGDPAQAEPQGGLPGEELIDVDGYQVNPATGEVYDQEGQYIGNLNEGPEEDSQAVEADGEVPEAGDQGPGEVPGQPTEPEEEENVDPQLRERIRSAVAQRGQVPPGTGQPPQPGMQQQSPGGPPQGPAPVQEEDPEVAQLKQQLQQLPQDPQTGRRVNPEGYQLDENTLDLFDPQGNPVGNLKDYEDDTQQPPNGAVPGR